MQGMQAAQWLKAACRIHRSDRDVLPHTRHLPWHAVMLVTPQAQFDHIPSLHQRSQSPRGGGLAHLQLLLQLRAAQWLPLLAQDAQHGLHQLRRGIGHGE